MPEPDQSTIPSRRRGKEPQKSQAEAEALSLSLPAALIHSKHPRALLHELHLLNQLLYKSNAQLRSAKWVQSVRALRKCGKRIFGDAGGEDEQGSRRSKRRKVMEDGGGGEGKVGNAGMTSKSEILSSSSSSSSNTAGGVFGKVQTRATALALTGSDKNAAAATADSSSASAGVIRLRSAEMSGETGAAWQGRRARQGRRGGNGGDLRASVTDLISLLRHLVERCNASYAIISAHLRTPPAPFLAPLATALLGVCAQCGTTATAWADDLERINWERDAWSECGWERLKKKPSPPLSIYVTTLRKVPNGHK